MKKKCSVCNESKPIEEFYPRERGKHGVAGYCKQCNSNLKKITYDFEKSKERQLLNSYNLTREDVNKMMFDQNNKCAICRTEIEFKRHKLHIDHCHKSNKVRGLLCRRCNFMLGWSNDNVKILQSAINYLLKF